MNEDKKKKNILIIGIIALVMILIGSTYAFFTYSRSTLAFTLTSSGISATFKEGTNEINFTNAYPISDEFALENLGDLAFIDFQVSGNIENQEEAITYELYLTEKDGNTLSSDFIKVYLTDENNNKLAGPSIYSSLENTSYTKDVEIGKMIFKDTKTGNFTENYRLYFWIDKNYSQNIVSQDFSFYVNIYAYNDDAPEKGSVTLTKKINALKEENPSCNYIVEDYDTNNNLEATYLSGPATGECAIDFNYVWYSGKLWRITAIYPDGSMKLITEDALTVINWGSNAEAYYDTTNNVGSWVYQWLNEDFYDTLVKADDYLIKNAEWNFSTDGNSTPVKPSTIETQKTTNAPVGLLNAYEYTNATASGNYLIIGYNWWLITPYSSSNVRYVNDRGTLGKSSPTGNVYGVRPSVYLKSGISMKGDGTKTNPFEINDNELVSAKTGDLLSSRISGEYVSFDNDLYRIVSTENDVTKITRVDYLRDETSSETIKPVLNKYFARSAYFGKTGNTKSDDYWDYYLNNTWYDSISSDYQNMMVDGIFYLGLYAGSGKHYKITICSDTASTLDGKITKLGVEGKSCTRYTSSNANKTFTGKVGLSRVGEMFSAQLGSGYSSSSTMWLITPYSSSYVRIVYDNDLSSYGTPAGNVGGVRPSIHLKSTVKILSGTGTELDPYVVGL